MKAVEYHNCPLCGVQPFNAEKVNHILHLILSILTGGLWLVVWIFLAISRDAPTCAKCGLPAAQAKRQEKKGQREQEQAHRRRLKMLTQKREEEARQRFNRQGPSVGERVKVTKGRHKGKFGKVVANEQGAITIADKAGHTMTLPLSEFRK